MIFVTGGTGLVGSHLLFELTSAGNTVKALARNMVKTDEVLELFRFYSNQAETLFSRIEWVEGDMLDYFFLKDALKDVTEIYHCAAFISFNPKDRKKMIFNNVEGTSNLVNAAIENKLVKFCHVSSIAALGTYEGTLPVNEETNWHPLKNLTGYSESKFFSEAEVWRGVEEGLNAVIINPSIIIGPATGKNGSAGFFNLLKNGFSYYTKGVKGFVGVKDVVFAMTQLMYDANFERVKNQRYLLNAENISLQDFFNKIADAFGNPRPNKFVSDALLSFLQKIAAVGSKISGKAPYITREIAATANKESYYDGSKIKQAIDFEYQAVATSILETVKFMETRSKKGDQLVD
ncbi:MAG: hypothetical protein CSA36_00525 [Draconibacterium sp.]|nr:MAG: hypothetical protein CSA36_00525 [Draconibacterium sp.]